MFVLFIICWFQEEELNNNRGEDRVRSHHAQGPGKRAGRTGWPQHVWALELKPWSVTQSRELLTGPTQPRFIYKEILRYDKVASDTVAPCQLASQTLTSWLRRRQLGGTLRLWRTELFAVWAGDQENIQVIIDWGFNKLCETQTYYRYRFPEIHNTVGAGDPSSIYSASALIWCMPNRLSIIFTRNLIF